MKQARVGWLLSLCVAAVFSDVRAEVVTDLIGAPGVHRVAQGETLLDIARAHDLGFTETRAANPDLDVWIPPVGETVTLPTRHVLPDAPRRGIVVNLSEQRLYVFPPSGGDVLTFPVGIGKVLWETPVGQTKVVRKRKNPSWTPPASIRAEHPDLPAVVPPGPNNPLGAYALDLGLSGYVIHGTSRPYGVGRRVSHGCVRLYPEDIERLFALVRVGTPVAFVDQPIKLGWLDGELYLEVHPTQAQADEVEDTGRFTPAHVPDIAWQVVRAAGEAAARVDWPRVDRAVAERRGVPVRITR